MNRRKSANTSLGLVRLDYLTYVGLVGGLTYSSSSLGLVVAAVFAAVLLLSPPASNGIAFSLLRILRWLAGRESARTNSVSGSLARKAESLTQTSSQAGSKLIAVNANSPIPSFALYRILGNDLEPRHSVGQTITNLRFILENEEEFAGVEKRWIVNRIADPSIENDIVGLLESRGQVYERIPFIQKDFLRVGWDFTCLPDHDYLSSTEFTSLGPKERQRLFVAIHRPKILYLMNNNGARNHALRNGRLIADWVLPWDGNCFLTPSGWKQISAEIQSNPELSVLVVPMHRAADNRSILNPNFQPNPIEEPQLIFRKDFEYDFNEDFPYGRRPKVEMLWLLGIPGPWDKWRDDPWDQVRRPRRQPAHSHRTAGWVVRLSSGKPELEAPEPLTIKLRGQEREKAIIHTLDRYSVSTIPPGQQLEMFQNNEESIGNGNKGSANPNHDKSPLATEIIRRAGEALSVEPYSVFQKETVAPSGDKRDYWHPAPYWWPDPHKKDGLPYIRKDGQRVLGSELFSSESSRYDRSNLQRMFEATHVLVLAWAITTNSNYLDKAAQLINCWFVDSSSAMSPHLEYAQVVMGRNDNRGNGSGIIEFKDFYYVLDSLKIARGKSPHLDTTLDGLSVWLRKYRAWVTDSKPGIKERHALNNQAIYYDLQLGSIELFLGDQDAFRWTFLRALSRIEGHFDQDGFQVNEASRADSRHYFHFNLQGWLNFLALANREGFLAGFEETMLGQRIRKAVGCTVKEAKQGWNLPQKKDFDDARTLVLQHYARALNLYDHDSLAQNNRAEIEIFYDVHSGIPPFWPFHLVNSWDTSFRNE